jgi:hypothetical protein
MKGGEGRFSLSHEFSRIHGGSSPSPNQILGRNEWWQQENQGEEQEEILASGLVISVTASRPSLVLGKNPR